ncbi:EamA family transporter RarD [Aliamphritea hakodatensis]|uniref:EamA family transporter RarD n=1 Tax=Aliamphritea hakodatensis TaxID=2895352 RepID=UPI0022FD8773|nr:EamA family transporter RarD [Aliamphritea hakodatensis]
MHAEQEQKKGIYFALAAYGMWGIFPIYFHAIASVSAMEILAHRIAWSLAFLAAILLISKRSKDILELLKKPKLLLSLTLTAVIVSANWLIFIWAVAQEQILEAALGYYINPLVSVFLGMIFLGERLRRGQWLAILLALAAVSYQLILLGKLPWIALSLAFSFGFYGLLRKTIPVDSILGLFTETLLLFPFAIGYMIWLASYNELVLLNASAGLSLLLLAAGIVTSLPLLCFTSATQRLSLLYIGLMQYIAPSISFLIAIFYFGETLDSDRLITFVMIWLALVIFTAEGLIRRRRAQTT